MVTHWECTFHPTWPSTKKVIKNGCHGQGPKDVVASVSTSVGGLRAASAAGKLPRNEKQITNFKGWGGASGARLQLMIIYLWLCNKPWYCARVTRAVPLVLEAFCFLFQVGNKPANSKQTAATINSFPGLPRLWQTDKQTVIKLQINYRTSRVRAVCPAGKKESGLQAMWTFSLHRRAEIICGGPWKQEWQSCCWLWEVRTSWNCNTVYFLQVAETFGSLWTPLSVCSTSERFLLWHLLMLKMKLVTLPVVYTSMQKRSGNGNITTWCWRTGEHSKATSECAGGIWNKAAELFKTKGAIVSAPGMGSSAKFVMSFSGKRHHLQCTTL